MGFEKQAERKWRLKSKSPPCHKSQGSLFYFAAEALKLQPTRKQETGNHKIPLLLQRAGIEAVNRY